MNDLQEGIGVEPGDNVINHYAKTAGQALRPVYRKRLPDVKKAERKKGPKR